MADFVSKPIFVSGRKKFAIYFQDDTNPKPYDLFVNEIAKLLNLNEKEVIAGIYQHNGMSCNKPFDFLFATVEDADRFCEEWLNPRLTANYLINNRR